jgi:hypothetical protein
VPTGECSTSFLHRVDSGIRVVREISDVVLVVIPAEFFKDPCSILCSAISACYQGSSFWAWYNDKVIGTSIPESVSPSSKVARNCHRREGECTAMSKVVFFKMR